MQEPGVEEMDTRDFSSGTYMQQYQYKSFVPAPVNIEWQVPTAI